MCGRFALHLANVDAEVQARYPFINVRAFRPRRRQRRNREERQNEEEPQEGAEDDLPVNQPEFYPRYNVAPRSFSLVIRRLLPEEEDSPEDKTFVIQNMKWGLVPSWQHTEGGELRTINARSEALLEDNTGMWAKIKGKKRCVVPVNGYYEWMKKGNHRIPYYTKHKSDSGDKYSPSIFLLAGLYDCTTIIDDEPSKPAEATSGNETIVHLGKDTMQGPRTLYTFTIVTTNSNRQLSFLHDRMPVILDSKEDVETWLDPSIDWDSKVLGRLLKPYEAEVDCYQVPTEVGKIGMNDPSFVRPVSQRKDGIEAMFMKQKAKAASLSPQKQSLKAVKEEKHVAIDFPDNVKSESDTEIKQEDSKHTVQSTSSAKLKRKFSPAARDESPDSSDTPQEESKPSTSKAPPSTPKKRLKTEPSSPNKGTTSKKASGSPTKPPSKAKGKAPATPSKKKATITDFFSKVS